MHKQCCCLLICLTALAFSGCGTKGPLYIPEQRYPQQVLQQAPDAQPASKMVSTLKNNDHL